MLLQLTSSADEMGWDWAAHARALGTGDGQSAMVRMVQKSDARAGSIKYE